MRTIAYLGPEHTNTHLAALARFGRRARYVHAPTIEDVFHLVERRQADDGVVPVENSLEGAVTHTLDRFIDFIETPVRIHGEMEQRIQHYLIRHVGARLSEIEVVYSHPQALAQCRGWLDRHLPNSERQETNSTAEAVDWVAGPGQHQRLKRLHEIRTITEPYQRAAIGRAELASQKLPHGWKLQAIPIPEERENKTRFLVLGLGEAPRGRHRKTSILFALKDRPGALYDALAPFKQGKINLTKIESRPSKRKAWEYVFFIDFIGHERDPKVQRALKALGSRTAFMRVLGSYPVATR